MLKIKKEVILIALVIIIAGLIMFFIKGLNYDLDYGKNTKIEIYFETKPEISELKNIVTEVFGEKNKIKNANNLETDILIIAESIDDEKIGALISKINEKYNLEITEADILIENSPKTSLIDLIRVYVMPVVITTLLTLVYFAIKYRKNEMINSVLTVLCSLIGISLIYLSIYSIIRIPVSKLTMPIYMLVYILTLILLVEICEKNSIDKKEQN